MGMLIIFALYVLIGSSIGPTLGSIVFFLGSSMALTRRPRTEILIVGFSASTKKKSA